MNRRKFTTALAGGAGLFAALLGRKAAAQVSGPEIATLDTWQPGRALVQATAGRADHAKLVRLIWKSYGLAAPNHHDTSDVFCDALLADWQRKRSAYVWRSRPHPGTRCTCCRVASC